LLPAETASLPSPVPIQIVASDEYPPVPQTERQRRVEARLYDYSLPQHAELARHDRFADLKAEYRRNGGRRSNLRYGWVAGAG